MKSMLMRNKIKFSLFRSIFFVFLLLLTVNFRVNINDNEKHNSFDPLQNHSTPEEEGIDSGLLAAMLGKIKTDSLKVRSVIIIRNGHLVLECYVHPYNKEVTHDVKSVIKSIISALVGIALRENIIGNLKQKVSYYLPEYFQDADSLKREIDLSNLLSMSTGLDLDENGPVMAEIMSKDDWIKETFRRPLVSVPGEQFFYCTFLTHTMSILLNKASGMGLLEFGKKFLFELLDIKKIYWGKGPRGFYFGGDRLWLTPRAMAKFGYLYLSGGKWGDDQILPEEWVKESTRNQFDEFPDSNYTGYGYWWWLGKNGSYHARGAGGQIISVYPDKEMVVVFTGAYNFNWQYLTNDYIIPAISKVGSLPPNPIAEKRIREITQDLELPGVQSPQPLPVIAGLISGKKYILQKNDMNFSEFTLWFDDPNECRFFINSNEGKLDLKVGLDGVYRVTDKVQWGMKPDNNTFALKGDWINENKLFIDFQEVGEPWYLDVELEFDKGKLISTFIWQPFEWKFDLNGNIN